MEKKNPKITDAMSRTLHVTGDTAYVELLFSELHECCIECVSARDTVKGSSVFRFRVFENRPYLSQDPDHVLQRNMQQREFLELDCIYCAGAPDRPTIVSPIGTEMNVGMVVMIEVVPPTQYALGLAAHSWADPCRLYLVVEPYMVDAIADERGNAAIYVRDKVLGAIFELNSKLVEYAPRMSYLGYFTHLTAVMRQLRIFGGGYATVERNGVTFPTPSEN